MHSADICSGSEFKAPMVPSTAWRPRPPSGRGCPLGRRAEEAGPTALCLRCSLTGGAVRCRVGGPSAARPCLRNLACRAGAGGAVAAGDSAASGSPQQQAARRQRHQRRGHDVVGLAGCARARWSPELRGPEWGRTTRPLLQGRARRSLRPRWGADSAAGRRPAPRRHGRAARPWVRRRGGPPAARRPASAGPARGPAAGARGRASSSCSSAGCRRAPTAPPPAWASTCSGARPPRGPGRQGCPSPGPRPSRASW
mmetsp:Transcript_77919/g.210653  ORF Transcript_77919/g.210653 Transcript_77919/m.210653 type:complete len:255 (+) Transcript_77919:152-916(+)